MKELLRLATAVVALCLLAYPFTITGISRGYVALAVPVVLLTVSGLVLWSETAITLAAASLVFPYAVALAAADRPVDPLAPVAAALLLVFLQLSDVAMAAPPTTPVDPAFVRSLALRCAGLVTLGVAVGTAVLGLSLLRPPDSQWLRTVGIIAGAIAVATPVRLLGRATTRGGIAGRWWPRVRP